jgi:hypothetical protein
MKITKRLIISICLGIAIYWISCWGSQTFHNLTVSRWFEDVAGDLLFAVDRGWPWEHAGSMPSQGCCLASECLLVLMCSSAVFIVITLGIVLKRKWDGRTKLCGVRR